MTKELGYPTKSYQKLPISSHIYPCTVDLELIRKKRRSAGASHAKCMADLKELVAAPCPNQWRDLAELVSMRPKQNWLVVWNPLKKWVRQLGWLFPTEWGKNMFQATNFPVRNPISDWPNCKTTICLSITKPPNPAPPNKKKTKLPAPTQKTVLQLLSEHFKTLKFHFLGEGLCIGSPTLQAFWSYPNLWHYTGALMTTGSFCSFPTYPQLVVRSRPHRLKSAARRPQMSPSLKAKSSNMLIHPFYP